jgi:hypothetical protein
MGLCSAAFSIRYWQGVADETALGKNVWLRPMQYQQSGPAA